MRKTLLPGRQHGSEAPEFDPVDDGHLVGVSITEIRAAAPTYPDDEVVRQRGAWIVMVALALAALAAVAAVVTWGGNSSSPTAPVNDFPGQASSTPPPVKSEKQKIVDTYLGYWKAQNAALRTADPNYPSLADYTATRQLQVVHDAVQRVRDQGWQTRNPPNSVAEARVTVESIDGDHARFRSCELDDSVVVRADTGEPLASNRGVGTALWAGELLREGGSWKVSYAARQQKWEGVAGCWLEK